MINIAEILKNSPEGTEVYCPMFGTVTFTIVDENTIKVKVPDSGPFCFDKYGRYTPDGKCFLFPSKENQDWSTFNLHCKFKPFDKIVGRFSDGFWTADFFSYYKPGNNVPFRGISGYYYQCFPYNKETAKLIGTTDEYNG